MATTLAGLLKNPNPPSHLRNGGTAANAHNSPPPPLTNQMAALNPPGGIGADGRPTRPPDDPPFDIDDPAAHYPRPGYGLGRTLPPEQDDLSWLVDNDYNVYSHLYQTDPQAASQILLGGGAVPTARQ